MGADFKAKAKRSFEKCWDNAAVDANTPDLFCKRADRLPDRFEAEAISNSRAELGEGLSARVEQGKVIARRGLSPVLVISKPTDRLIKSINEGCNIARVNVVGSDPISGTYEVTIH